MAISRIIDGVEIEFPVGMTKRFDKFLDALNILAAQPDKTLMLTHSSGDPDLFDEMSDVQREIASERLSQNLGRAGQLCRIIFQNFTEHGVVPISVHENNHGRVMRKILVEELSDEQMLAFIARSEISDVDMNVVLTDAVAFAESKVVEELGSPMVCADQYALEYETATQLAEDALDYADDVFAGCLEEICYGVCQDHLLENIIMDVDPFAIIKTGAVKQVGMLAKFANAVDYIPPLLAKSFDEAQQTLDVLHVLFNTQPLRYEAFDSDLFLPDFTKNEESLVLARLCENVTMMRLELEGLHRRFVSDWEVPDVSGMKTSSHVDGRVKFVSLRAVYHAPTVEEMHDVFREDVFKDAQSNMIVAASIYAREQLDSPYNISTMVSARHGISDEQAEDALYAADEIFDHCVKSWASSVKRGANLEQALCVIDPHISVEQVLGKMDRNKRPRPPESLPHYNS